MKLRSLVTSASMALVSASLLVAQQPTGKIHGKVSDPTGMIKTAGTVSLSTDGGHTAKYSFPVGSDGMFTGDGVAPGTYSVVLRLPETPPDKEVDQIDNVKIVSGQDTLQDIDMSRKEYLDKMTPEQRKQVEEFKKKNEEVLKGNQVIKNLNADLNEARQDNKDKKYQDAETLMLKDTAAKPDGELLWFELGLAQVGLKKWDDAAASLKKTIEVGSAAKKPSADLIGGAQAALGEVYARSNKPTEAQAAYDDAAKANPVKAGTYYSNATIIFSQVGNADAQAAAADKAITADPKNPIPYYLKGQALAGKITVDSKTGAYVLPPGCAEAYQKYLELAPNGQFANEAKALLAETQSKVNSKYKAPK